MKVNVIRQTPGTHIEFVRPLADAAATRLLLDALAPLNDTEGMALCRRFLDAADVQGELNVDAMQALLAEFEKESGHASL